MKENNPTKPRKSKNKNNNKNNNKNRIKRKNKNTHPSGGKYFSVYSVNGCLASKNTGHCEPRRGVAIPKSYREW